MLTDFKPKVYPALFIADRRLYLVDCRSTKDGLLSVGMAICCGLTITPAQLEPGDYELFDEENSLPKALVTIDEDLPLNQAFYTDEPIKLEVKRYYAS